MVTQPLEKGKCKSFQLPDLFAFPVPSNFFPAPISTPSFSLGFTFLNFFVSSHLHLFTLLMYTGFYTHVLHHLPGVIHTHLSVLTTEHFLNFSLHFFLYHHLPTPRGVKSFPPKNIRSFIPSSPFFFFFLQKVFWPFYLSMHFRSASEANIPLLRGLLPSIFPCVF